MRGTPCEHAVWREKGGKNCYSRFEACNLMLIGNDSSGKIISPSIEEEIIRVGCFGPDDFGTEGNSCPLQDPRKVKGAQKFREGLIEQHRYHVEAEKTMRDLEENFARFLKEGQR